jgi:hypothetical protein
MLPESLSDSFSILATENVGFVDLRPFCSGFDSIGVIECQFDG